MKNFLMLVLALCLGLASTAAFAQDKATTGSIGGTVVDVNGAAVPNATVTVTGAQATRTATANADGVFVVENLIPGNYTVKIEQQGFKTATAQNVTVYVGKQSTLSDLKLEPGAITETVNVTTDVATIDQASTAVGSNLNDQLFQNIPVQL